MASLDNLPQEILFNIFKRNQDRHGYFADTMKLVSRKCRRVVINRQLDLVDVHSVCIENLAGVENGSQEGFIVAKIELETEMKRKFETMTSKAQNGPINEVLKNMVEATLLNKVKSLKKLKLLGVDITPELLDQIGNCGIDLKKIKELVMNDCTFQIQTEQLYNFLEKLNLMALEMRNSKFQPGFITEKLIRLPTYWTLISCKELTTSLNISNDLLNGLLEQPDLKLLKYINLINIQTGITLEALAPVLRAIHRRPEIDHLRWVLGVFEYNTMSDYLLQLQRNHNWKTKITNEYGMRMYTMTLVEPFDQEGTRECKIVFWMR